MNTGRACFDHGAHQFEGIQIAAKARFRVGHNGGQPVDAIMAGHVRNLIGAQQRVVQAARQVGSAVGRVERLVGVGLARIVGITRNLPATEVDRLEPCLHHLDCLVACHRPQRPDEWLGVEQIPQPFGAAARQRVFNMHGAAQPHHFFGCVAAVNALPAWILTPAARQIIRCL